MNRIARLIAAALMAGALAVACAPADEPEKLPEHTAQTSQRITTDDILARAREWVADAVPYCGGVNGGHDAICGGTCNRPSAPWDAWRSDCSGYVSWCWELAAPGPTTDSFQFDRSGDDGWSTISPDELQPGDALVTNGHIKLFAFFTGGSSMDILEEYDCNKVAREVSQGFTRSGNTLRFNGDSRVYHAIRRNGLGTSSGDYGIPAASAFRYHEEQHFFGRDVDGSLEHWTWTEEGGLADLEFWGNGLVGEPRGYVYQEQQHVFARTDGDQLTHWVWNPTGGVTGPEPWGDAGGLTSDPTGFVYGGQQHVFGRSPDGTLAHWWWIPDEDLHYSDWGGDKIIGTPVSFVWGDQQHIFARVEGDRLAHWYWIPDDDDDPGLHYVIWPGTITSDPAGFAYDQEQHVYGRSANGNYEHWSWSADTGVQVDERDEPLVGSPMAYVFGDQRHLVAQSPGNTLAHWWWTPDDGDHYADWGGSLTGHVSAFVIPDLQHIFGRNDDGTLSHWWWDPTGVGFEDWGGTLAQ